MGYQEYLELFAEFNTQEGYMKACRHLAFENNKWQEFDAYKQSLAETIKQAHKEQERPLVVADVCCGEYAWIARHFSEHTSKIYALDMSEAAVQSVRNLNQKVSGIIGDASKELHNLQDIDFIYCGFNAYPEFIEGFAHSLHEQGKLYVMRPKTGDDLTLRSIVKGYDIRGRIQEIHSMTEMMKENFSIEYDEQTHHFHFNNTSTEELLAAMSVVSFGDKQKLSRQTYHQAVEYLTERTDGRQNIVLSQELSIWKGGRR